MMTFGKAATYQSEDKVQVMISDDRRALTLAFSDLQISSGGSASAAPVATRAFAFVVPLEGDEKKVEIEFVVGGFVRTLEGATATFVCSVNGQTVVADFPANSDQSVQQKLAFAADTPSECRLSVLLLGGADSTKKASETFANVLTIDAEILPRIR